MRAFCESHGITYEQCGKVIIATSERELPALDELYRRGTENGVPGLRRIGVEELQDLEPHASGIAALHSPQTAIVDYGEVARAMAQELQDRGVDLFRSRPVRGADVDGEGLRLSTPLGSMLTRYLVNCAGLHADALARAMGARPELRIVPFRGEYYFLRPERQDLVRGLIYPVPDPDLPFLGVHFTRTVHGRVEAGPNAVLALAREGYTHRTIQPRHVLETMLYPGFRRLVRAQWRTGIDEFYRSFSKQVFARSLQRLVPAVQSSDLVRGGAGVRAQAIAESGKLVDDFAIEQSPRAIHVLNAPSPAATASLAIGDYIASIAMQSVAGA